MEDNTKKYDFFAAIVKNPDLELNDFKQLGVTPDNAQLKDKSEYENMPQIKQMFSKPDGTFDKESFDKLYDNVLLTYNNFDTLSYAPKVTELFGYLSSDWDRPLNAPIMDTTPWFEQEEYIQDESFGIDYIDRAGQGIYANKTAKEIAESQEVVDYTTGEKLGWTPEDKGGLFKGLVRPTIVMATYDEDEDEQLESGEIIHHKKGDLKFNEYGRPYAETLGDRDINQKQQIAYSDTLLRETSAWNKYNFFDSDDYEKSFVGTVAKTVFKTIPYFIPYLNYAVGAVTALEAFGRVLPVIGKAINGVWTNDSENEFYSTMNRWEGYMSRFDPTVTQESEQELVTFENFGNLISSISGQLFQQKAVGMAGLLFNLGENGTKNAAKIGRALSYSYMAATSSQESYAIAKNAGASDRVAGLFMIGNMVSLYGLMHINYFRDNFLKGTYMDESEFRQPAFDYARTLKEKLGTDGAKLVAEGEKAVTKKENLRFLGKLVDFYHNTMVPSVVKGGLPARMMSEATEEVMEEVVTDAWKAAAKGLEAIGIKVSDEDKRLDFGFTAEDVAKRYGMAFAGGFIGGGIFAGQQKYEDWIMHRNIATLPDEDLKKLTYYIAQGRGKEIKDYYTKWHRKGLLGSRNLGTNLTTIQSVDGTNVVAEPIANGRLSQNDIVYRHLMNTVDFLEKVVSSEGLRFTKQQLDNLRKTGLDVNENTLRAQTLIDLGGYSTLEDDLLNLAKDIVAKNNEIQGKIEELTVPNDTSEARKSTEDAIKNNAELKQLEDELKELRKKRDDILEGKYNYRYALQSLFISDKQLSNAFINLSKDNFARLKYGELYSKMTEDQQKIVDKDFENYKSTEGKEKVIKAADIYYALASRWGANLLQKAKLLDGFNIDTLHSNVNLESELVERRKRLLELEQKILGLEAKQDRTEEDNQQLAQYQQEYFNIIEEFEAFEEIPGRLLALANSDEHFKEITSLLLNPHLNEEGLARIGDLLIELYKKAGNDKIVLSGDSELQVLYNEIRRGYLSHSDPATRMNTYFDAKMNQSAEVDLQNDAPEGSDWENQQFQVNTGNYDDMWYMDEPGERSELHKDVEGFLNTFIENFGYNNTVAMNAYNNLVNALKTRTKLTDEQILEFLSYVLPALNGRSIVDFMTEVDALRANVTYSPISDLLQDFWFDYAGIKSNIIDLLNSEEKKLSSSDILSKYSLTPMVEEDLKTAKDILNVLGAILVGSTNKTNATINSFKFNPKELPVLENKVALILANDLDQLVNRINYLITLTESNKIRAFKIHERIDKNMRSKFLQVLTNPAFVAEFEKEFHYHINDEDRPINLKDILDSVTPPGFSFDNIELINPTQLQTIWTEFCQKVTEELSKTPQFKDDNALAKSLVSLMGKDIWKLNTTTLSDQIDVDIKPVDKLTLLMSICSLPSRAFYNRYKAVTQKEDFPFAPIFGQEYATYNALAYLARPGLFNAALTLIKDNAKSEFATVTDEVKRKYLEDLSALKNIFIILGSAGTGKTVGVVGTIVSMLSDYDKKQYLAVAPKKVQAERLQKQIGDDCKYLIKNDFMKLIHNGQEPSAYSAAENGHFVRSSSSTYNKNVFDNSKDVKILFIDEVSLFTEAELSEISNWAVQNGVFVLGLGDAKQNSAKAFVTTQTKGADEKPVIENGKPVTQTSGYASGLEDCMYFSCPMLTSSLRNANYAKLTNSNMMDKFLFDAWNLLLENRSITIRQVDDLLPSEIELKYYEENGQFFGDKVVADDYDFATRAVELKTKGKVAIIYDGNDAKYDSLKDKGINIIAFDDMQGDEFDYVLVDVDFKNQAMNGASVSKYLLLKNLYTITQRSTSGTYIKHDKVDSAFDIVDSGSDVEMRQEISLTKGQIESFKKYRAKAMENLAEDNTFFEYFKKMTVAPPPQGGSNNGGGNDGGGNGGGNPNEEPVTPTPGRKLMSTEGIHKYIFSKAFRTSQATNEHSLFKITQKLNPNADFKVYNADPVNPNLTLYTEAMSYFGSIVRMNKTVDPKSSIFQKFITALGLETTDKLRQYFTGNRTLHIVEYNGNEKLLIARFHNGNDYIEIPVCTVTTAFVGDYNGQLYRKRTAKIHFGDTFKTLSEIQKEFPGVFWFGDAGVVVYDPNNIDSILKDPNLTDGAKRFLTRLNKNGKSNLGKVLVIMTDELFDLEQYNDLWKQPKSKNGEKVNLITHYDQLSTVAVHKPLDMRDVISYVDAIKRGRDGAQADLSNIIANSLWENPNDPVEVLKSLDWSLLPARETPAFYSEIYKRRWQILPSDRGQRLAGLLAVHAANNPEYKSILDNLLVFLHTFVSDTGTIERENHGIIISNKNKSIYVETIWNGDLIEGYSVHSYGALGIGTELARLTEPYPTFPVNDLINGFLDGNQEISIKLLRDVTRTDGNKSYIDVTTNDALYTELSSFVSNKVLTDKLTNDMLKTNEFCNFIYMDDMVQSDSFGKNEMLPGSTYFGRFKGDIMSGYVAPISGITYSMYEIDESKVSGARVVGGENSGGNPGNNPGSNSGGVDPRLNPIKSSITIINQLIKTHRLGDEIKLNDSAILERLQSQSPEELISSIMQDVNSKNQFSMNNWMGNQIVFENGKFNVVKVNNKEAWIKFKTKDIGTDVNIVEGFDYLDTRRYAVISINQNGNMINALIRWEAGTYQIRSFNSFDTFKELLYICKSNQQLFKDIAPYIHSLVYNPENNTSAYNKQGYNWLCENYYDLTNVDQINPLVAELVNALNKHLENRLKEHEC